MSEIAPETKTDTEAGRILDAEFENWANAGRKPRFFLRDDDAFCDSPALRRLITICNKYQAPLLLAAIPARADISLGRLVRGEALITGAVHGYAHVSHSHIGEKPCELSRRRSSKTILAELTTGRKKLLNLFDGKVSGLLVPPWNRIHDEAVPLAARAGFSGISSHGWPEDAKPGEGGGPLPRINTHIDIIHWSAGGIGRNNAWVISEIARNLNYARINNYAAIGILTHHRNHDEQAWNVLELIMRYHCAAHCKWVSADALLQQQIHHAARYI
jgi:peptidoglycan/xylan/chitin deacetylase (PgdA/CDA1 family)